MEPAATEPSNDRSAASPRQTATPSPAPSDDARRAVVELLDRYGPRLHALAMRLCRHRADADDMVQDIFLTALRKWHTFRGEADPGTWLHAIAARSCKARTRRKGGIDRRQVPMSQLMPWSEKTVMEVAAADEGAEDASQRQEAIARVQAEVARLPEHLRLPLVLKDVLQMSVEDVAAALGLAENTVKTRLHRARLALRKAMTARARAVDAPAPIYEKQVCLDLLKAKLDAMDRGDVAGGSKLPQAEMCARCRAVFRELDLVQEACTHLGEGKLPASLREKITRMLEDRARTVERTPRRGRKPIRGGGSLPST
ncbi:MAG: RNA polymerase sigma factor [Tepidisphaerales bacterium]